MTSSYNCIICAEEFLLEELHNVKLSEINVTNFKICESCLELSDPDNDYQEVKTIVSGYNKLSDAKALIKSGGLVDFIMED